MSGERTEPATAKRIRDSRKRGQVPKSREFTSAATFVSLVIYLYLAAPYYTHEIKQMILLATEFYDINLGVDAYYFFYRVMFHAFLVTYPVLLLVFVVGIASNIAHIGLVVSFEVIKPNLSHLDMIGSAKRIFSKSNFFEFLKSTAKIFILGYIIYTVIEVSISALIIAPGCGIDCVLGLLKSQIRQILIYTCAAFIVVACFDLFFQRLQYFNRLKMSKQEVKQEYKETEGDPAIKGRRQQLHQEMIAQQVEQATEESTAVVINPTHIAVAFFYDADQEKLPVVKAKGRGTIANIIIRVAKQKNIPLFRNVPLAHSLYSYAQVDHYIPRDLIKPVAEVIRWVNHLQQQKKRDKKE